MAPRRAALEAAGVEVVHCNPYHPEVLLPALATRGISSLLVEGGAKTARRGSMSVGSVGGTPPSALTGISPTGGEIGWELAPR
ncbi:hypothetical protein ACC791_37380, partial [Rhizobium ruizarguesonis]